MWFLIKGSFWFAAVLVVLSYFGTRSATENDGASALEVAGALSAATEAYHYVSALCSEKPDVCEKGAETVSALGVRAREGARVAFELLDKQFGDGQFGDGQFGDGQFGDGQPAKGNSATVVLADPAPTPFPAKQSDAAAAASDRIFTGTIVTGTVPVPQKRPTH